MDSLQKQHLADSIAGEYQLKDDVLIKADGDIELEAFRRSFPKKVFPALRFLPRTETLLQTLNGEKALTTAKSRIRSLIISGSRALIILRNRIRSLMTAMTNSFHLKGSRQRKPKRTTRFSGLSVLIINLRTASFQRQVLRENSMML